MQEEFAHTLMLDERSKLTMTGVAEVVSFDDMTVVLKTGLGQLLVQGQDLKLRTLSPEGGQVEVDGNISALAYAEPRQSGSWLGRLFG